MNLPVDNQSMFRRRFALVLLLPLVAGVYSLSSQSLEELLRRPAVQPPADVQSGLSGHQDSDEIDQEIERYFSNASDAHSTDMDSRRLEQLFGSSAAAPAPPSTRSAGSNDGAFSFANRGTAADASDGIVSHKVVQGDTIWNISRRYSVTTESILEHNPELKSRALYIGEEILVTAEASQPAPVAASQPLYYTVKRGDTLSAIARRHRLTVPRLKSLNQLRNASIQPGQQLVVGRRAGPPAGYRYEAFFDWPLRGVITSGFGRRYNPFVRHMTNYHKGIDIGAPMGQSFKAARDGVVIFSGRMGGYGNAIFVRHTNGYVSVYAHNMKNLVAVGDVVKRGQELGLVGRTGSATGPHLHFEVRQRRQPINPIGALNMRELVRADQVAVRN